MTTSYQLGVEQFSLFDRDGDTILHFEVDPDLYVGCKDAIVGAGGHPHPSMAGLVLIELGIDGYPTHRVRVERTGNIPGPDDDPRLYDDAFNYEREEAPVAMLDDAINALQALRDQLDVMQTAEKVREQERSAFSLGADAGAYGMVKPAESLDDERGVSSVDTPGCGRCGMAADAMIHHASANGHDMERGR
jgi:hypothetical protein